MSNDQDAPELISIGAQSLVESANRLGLTWQLRPAVITLTDPLKATYDGDTASIGMVNLTGPVTIGARVMALFVPPSGNFIIGSIRVDDLPAFNEDGTDASFSNTGYDVGATTVGVAFIAPASGSIYLTITGYLTMSNNSFSAYLSYQLAEGPTIDSGTVIEAPSDEKVVQAGRAVVASGPAHGSASWRTLITSLTPGASYNVTLYKRVTGGTGSYSYRSILIEAVR